MTHLEAQSAINESVRNNCIAECADTATNRVLLSMYGHDHAGLEGAHRMSFWGYTDEGSVWRVNVSQS